MSWVKLAGGKGGLGLSSSARSGLNDYDGGVRYNNKPSPNNTGKALNTIIAVAGVVGLVYVLIKKR